MKVTKTLAQDLAELYAQHIANPESKDRFTRYGRTTEAVFKDIVDTAQTLPANPSAIYTYAYGICVTPISHPPQPQQLGAVSLFQALKPLFIRHQVQNTDVSFLDVSIGGGGARLGEAKDRTAGAHIRQEFLNANVYKLTVEFQEASHNEVVDLGLHPKSLRSAPEAVFEV